MVVSLKNCVHDEVQGQTELGKQFESHIKAQTAVPDALLVSILKARLESPDCSKRGWILDGWPRTAGQFEAMEAQGLLPEAIVVQTGEQDPAMALKRRVDPVSDTPYSMMTSMVPTDPEVKERLVSPLGDEVTTKETVAKQISQHQACWKDLSSLDAFKDRSVETVIGHPPTQVWVELLAAWAK